MKYPSKRWKCPKSPKYPSMMKTCERKKQWQSTKQRPALITTWVMDQESPKVSRMVQCTYGHVIYQKRLESDDTNNNEYIQGKFSKDKRKSLKKITAQQSTPIPKYTRIDPNYKIFSNGPTCQRELSNNIWNLPKSDQKWHNAYEWVWMCQNYPQR